MAIVNSLHHKLKSGFCRYYGIPALHCHRIGHVNSDVEVAP